MSYLTKLRAIWRIYQDEIMVSFIYLAWGTMMQLEMIVNTGAMRFTVWTTGTPMVIAMLFYGLKRIAMFVTEQLELEKFRKEHEVESR